MNKLLMTALSFFLPVSVISIGEGAPVVNLAYEIDPHECDTPFPVEPTQNAPPPPNLDYLTDLEKSPQDFVLESKEIKISEFPMAFNPTIVRWNDGLLLGFRIRDPKTASTNQIGMVWVDEEFNLISPPYVLHVPPYPSAVPFKQQDPRLIVVSGHLYMVYSNIIQGAISREVRRVFLTEVHFDGNHFYTDPPEGLFYFEGESEQRWEKNWVPFDYGGDLYLAYSLFPHLILKPLFGTNSCETAAWSKSDIRWKWGHLRGGTQAYLDGGHYLSFFHSSINMATVQSNGVNFQHYFFGAYLFSATPPFEITHISPEPIIGKGFYSGPAYKTWKPLRVVFPGGFIFNEEFVWVVYGRQDHEIWVAKLDKKKILESMMPVSPVVN